VLAPVSLLSIQDSLTGGAWLKPGQPQTVKGANRPATELFREAGDRRENLRFGG
jgi:hypothetical protein